MGLSQFPIPRAGVLKDFKQAVGDRTTSATTTSTSFVAIPGLASVTVAAAVGDVIEVDLTAQPFQNSNNSKYTFNFGAATGDIASLGIYVAVSSGNTCTAIHYLYTVVAGDLVAGNLTVTAKMLAVGGVSVTLRNDTEAAPVLIAKNLGVVGGWASSGSSSGVASKLIARRVATLACSIATQVDVPWDTEDLDTDGYLTPTSTTVTIPAGGDGVYSINAQGIWSSAPGNVRSFIAIEAGGVRYVQPGGHTEDYIANHITVSLIAGDTIKVNVFQNQGSLTFTGRLEVYRLTSLAAQSGTSVKGVILTRTESSLNNTNTNFSWDTEVEDVSGWFSAPSTTFTVPTGEGGIYTLSLSASFGVGMTARSNIEITAAGRSWRAFIGVGEDKVALGVTVRLAAAETVTCWNFQSSGGTRNVVGRLEIWKVGV